MSVINRALSHVTYAIPKRILELAFRFNLDRIRHTPVSIENQILTLVIRPRVLVDCNLVGGVEALIDLQRCEREEVELYSTVFRVPKELTQGRSIVSVKSVSFMDPNAMFNIGTSGLCGRSGLLTGAQAVLEAQADIPKVATQYVHLIGENVVMVRGTMLIPANSYLRCVLEYDQHLSNLSPRSYSNFSKLVEYAVKAFIYNNLVIELDEGYLMGGQELGAVRSIIESYADANELYEDYLKQVMTKVLYMQDDERMNRHVKLLMGGYR